jgi:hypothetical protein
MAKASRIEQINASNIFRLQKGGANFSNTVMAAARRTIQGTSTAADASLIRQQLGIQRSGARQAKAALQSAQRAQSTIVSVGTSIEQISRGGGAATVGFVNLVKLGSSELDRLARSRTMRNVFESVGARFFGGADVGARAHQSFRRALARGGVVIQTALAGAELVQDIVANRRAAIDQRNANQGLNYDLARQNNIDFQRQSREGSDVEYRLAGEEHWLGRYLRGNGWDTGHEAAIKSAKTARAEMHSKTRAAKAAGMGGINPGDVLSAYAQKKGKSVTELTDWERDQALDEAAAWVSRTQNGITTNSRADDPDTYLDDPMVDTELAIVRHDASIGQNWLEAQMTVEQKRARRRRIAEEKVMPARLNYHIQRQKDLATAADMAERSLTAGQRLDQAKINQVVTSKWMSTVSRHRAWNND